jgi:hypothetical protein
MLKQGGAVGSSECSAAMAAGVVNHMQHSGTYQICLSRHGLIQSSGASPIQTHSSGSNLTCSLPPLPPTTTRDSPTISILTVVALTVSAAPAVAVSGAVNLAMFTLTVVALAVGALH